MDKKAIFNHYSNLIDDMLENSLWMEMWFQNPYYLDCSIYGEECNNLPCNIIVTTGATRACLIDDNYDWVVKFDIEEDNYGSACRREENIYAAAKKEKLDKYFCEVAYIGTYTKTFNFYNFHDIEQVMNFEDYDEEYFDNELMKHEDDLDIVPITVSIPLYAYRRADEYDCGPIDKSLINSAQKVASPLRERNIAIAVAFIRDFGIDEYNRFSAFSMKKEINDIHFGNIGMVDNFMCLIDYAGYHGTSIDQTGNLSWKHSKFKS